MRRFRYMRILAVMGMMAVPAGCSKKPDSPGRTLDQQIETVVSKYVQPDGPGCVVGVIREGNFLMAGGFGLADVERKEPITKETVFDAAAISRQFAAANVAWLITNGAVRMDDNIRVFIPEMPRVDPAVTIGNLMYHTSGMRDYIEMLRSKGITTVADDLDIVDMLAKEDMLFAAGSKYSPSRSDYFLLAFVAQRVTSASLAEWSQKIIFGPLAMNNTVFSDHPQKKPTNMATGYDTDDSQGDRFKKSARNLASIAGDAGLYTNVGDLLVWEKAMYAPDFSKSFGVLPDATGRTSDGADIDFAMGMNIGELNGAKMFSCAGATDGFSAAMLRVPGWKLTVICMANRSDIDVAALADGVIRLCVPRQ